MVQQKALTVTSAYLLKDRQAQADDAKTRARLTASLAVTLKKPKTGAPKTVEMGPVLENGQPKLDLSGNALFKYNIYNADGFKNSSFEGNQEIKYKMIDVGKKGDAKFGEVLASNNAKNLFHGHLDASDKARESEQQVGQLLDIIVASPDFTSGPFQSLMLPLKSFALSFGLIGKDDKTIDNITVMQII